MKVSVKKELGEEFDALIVPLSEESVSGQAALALPGLPEMMKEAVLSAVKAGNRERNAALCMRRNSMRKRQRSSGSWF